MKRVFGSALLHVPHPHHAPPRAAGGSVNPTAVLALSCGILFLIAVNTTAINTALNAIAEDLDMGTSELSWAVGIYMLSVAAFVVLGGRLGDMFGELRMVVGGLLVFAIAALLVAAAQGAPMAILGRALQGAGAAALMPASMAVLRLAFPPERQGFALGIWGATGGLGFAIGPLIGGAVTDLVGWRWIWWASVIAAVVLASIATGTLRAMPRPTERPQMDRPGIVLLPVALFALIFAIQQAPTWGWGSAETITAFAVSGIAFTALVVVELRKGERDEAPMLHLALLRIPALVGAILGTWVNTMSLIGILFFFNIYVQSIFTLDYSAVQASVALLPYGACVFIASLLIGPVCDRVGYRWPLAIGLALMGVGALLLSRVDADSGYGALWWCTMIQGVGVGMTFASPSAAGLRAVPGEEAGEASGIINVSRYVAAALVISVGSVVFTTVGANELNASLEGARLASIEREKLDKSLTGAPAQVEALESELDSAQLKPFREGSPGAIAAGFSAVNVGLGIISLLSALAWIVLMRPREP